MAKRPWSRVVMTGRCHHCCTHMPLESHNRYSGHDNGTITADVIPNPEDRSRWQQLHSLIYFGAGLKPAEAAFLFGRDEGTIAGWEAQERAPAAVWRALLAMAGDLGAVDEAFSGWTLVRGKLYSADMVDGWTPGEIRALPYLRGAIDAYRNERAKRLGRPGLESEADSRRTDPRGAEKDPVNEGRGAGLPRESLPLTRSSEECSAGAIMGCATVSAGGPRLSQPSGSQLLESPARSVPLEDSHGSAPTGRPDGRSKGTSPTLSALRASGTGGRRCLDSSSRAGSTGNAQDRSVIANAAEIVFQDHRNEAVQGQIQLSGLRSGAGVQVGLKAKQKGHGGTSESDITTISPTEQMISQRYHAPKRKKRQRNQSLPTASADEAAAKAQKSGAAENPLVGVYSQVPEEGGAGAASTLCVSDCGSPRICAQMPESHNRYYVK